MSTSNVYPTRDIIFISTKRGGVSMLYNDRQYHRKKIYVNKNSFWKCFTTKGCKGNITLNSRNEIVNHNAHILGCLGDSGKNIIKKKMDDLKRKTSSNFESIPKQYNDMVRDLKNDGYDIIADVPKFNSKLRFARALDVTVPKKYEKMLLCDYIDENKDLRLIIFCNDNMKTEIKNISHFFADGTFKSCPKGFHQLYTIHGYDDKTHIMTPIFYALLPNKKTVTYKLLLKLIKKQISDFQPAKITLDFEVAAINAFQQTFPEIIFKGCYYHFNRCLWKKAKSLKITTRVLKRHVSRCIGIARLPQSDIDEGYKYVIGRSPKDTKIKKFNKYFQIQWFKKQDFGNCSCANEIIRTNNNIEGWHRKINGFVGRTHPTLAHLLDVLDSEKSSYDLKKTTNKKKREYAEIDQEIESALNDLQKNVISVGHCIEIISPFVIPW
ncbi:hypothetical protein ABMA27_014837 [Loxostege sticticalis]|uniref:MULE transposase domain-containing protein n=1 Tax=Loxostege sticticalis TaxID=481309 RepID=A0ABR3IAE1_LOXSC